MQFVIQSFYLMSTLSQAGIGTLLLVIGVAACVFSYKNRSETDPEWVKKTKNHSDELTDKTNEYGLYFGGIMFVLLGIGMLLDAMRIYNFN